MQAEVASAASHLTTLLRTKPSSPHDLDEFKSVLSQSLHTRYARQTWTISDPEAGSAARALHWQPGPGGEGCSSPLSKACRRFGVAFGDKEEWTLWIDPGCVAIRDGPGPGRAATTSSAALYTSTDPATCFTPPRGQQPQQLQGGIRVLYGALPRSTATRTTYPSSTTPISFFPTSRSNDFALPSPTNRAAIIRRPATVGSAVNPHVPSVTICPSTPVGITSTTSQKSIAASWDRVTAVCSTDYQLASTRRLPTSRPSTATSTRSASSSTESSRSGSVGSTAYSALSLSASLSNDGASSAGTSIPATSPSPCTAGWSKMDGDLSAQAQVDASHEANAPIAFGHMDDLQGLGLDDLVFEDGIGPDDAPWTTAEAVVEGADDERHEEGDDTLRPLDGEDFGDTTVGTVAVAVAVPVTAAVPIAIAKPFVPASNCVSTNNHVRTQSTASASSVTSFDNGNVKVLGGGVKLGGSSCSSATSRAGRSRTHSNASNGSTFSGSGSGFMYKHHHHHHHHQHAQPASGFTRGHTKNGSSVNINARTGGWAAAQQQQQTSLGLSGMDPLPHAAIADEEFRHRGRPLALRPEEAQCLQEQQQQQHLPPAQQQQWPAHYPPPMQRHMSFPPPRLMQDDAQVLPTIPLADRRDLAPPLSTPYLGLPLAHQSQQSLRSTRSSGSLKAQAMHSALGRHYLQALPSTALQAFHHSDKSVGAASTPSSSSASLRAHSSSAGEEDEEDEEGEEFLDGDDSGDSHPGGPQTNGSGIKRTRTRGRRTRGRGTGRAARRAAAAAATAASTVGGAVISTLPLQSLSAGGGTKMLSPLPSPPLYHNHQRPQREKQDLQAPTGMRHDHPVVPAQQQQPPQRLGAHPMHSSLPPIPAGAPVGFGFNGTNWATHSSYQHQHQSQSQAQQAQRGGAVITSSCGATSGGMGTQWSAHPPHRLPTVMMTTSSKQMQMATRS